MKLITLILLGLATIAQADDIRTYSNGMTCIVGRSGIVYGCSGGYVRRFESYIDMQSGHTIQQNDPHSAVDIETGQILLMPPDMPFRDDDRYEDE